MVCRWSIWVLWDHKTHMGEQIRTLPKGLARWFWPETQEFAPLTISCLILLFQLSGSLYPHAMLSVWNCCGRGYKKLFEMRVNWTRTPYIRIKIKINNPVQICQTPGPHSLSFIRFNKWSNNMTLVLSMITLLSAHAPSLRVGFCQNTKTSPFIVLHTC